MVRSVESVALDILRSIEDRLITDGVVPLVATTAVDVALYILNQKRVHLNDIQQRYRVPITVNADEDMHISQFVIERAAEGEIANGPAAVHMDWAHHHEASPSRRPRKQAEAAEAERKQTPNEPRSRSRRRRRRRRSEGGGEFERPAHATRRGPTRRWRKEPSSLERPPRRKRAAAKRERTAVRKPAKDRAAEAAAAAAAAGQVNVPRGRLARKGRARAGSRPRARARRLLPVDGSNNGSGWLAISRRRRLLEAPLPSLRPSRRRASRNRQVEHTPKFGTNRKRPAAAAGGSARDGRRERGLRAPAALPPISGGLHLSRCRRIQTSSKDGGGEMAMGDSMSPAP